MTDQAQIVLTILNEHDVECPHAFSQDTHYLSYFVNEYGEQWIFVLNYDTGEAWVTGGDMEWKTYPVTGFQPGEDKGELLLEHLVSKQTLPFAGPLVLNTSEYVWLTACWIATRFIRDESEKEE